MSLKLKRFKLTQQVIVVFITAVFLPLLVAGFLLVNINQHSVRKELYYSAKVTLDNVNYRLLSSIDIPTYNLKFIANLITNKALKLSREEIVSLIQYIVYSVPQIRSIEIYSNKNVPVMSYNPDNLQSFDFLDFESETFIIVQKNGNQQIITLYCKVPKNIYDYKVIKANLNNNIMQQVIFSNISFVNRYIRIVNAEGYVVFAYPQKRTEIDSDPRFAVPPNILKETKVGEVVRFGPFKNQPALFYKVPNSNLSIIIYTPQSVTYYGIMLARQRILIVLALAAVLSIIIGFIYVSALNRNIRQLIKAVYAIALGNYSRKIRLIKGYFTPYELVFLADEFNAMADKINSTLKALKEANDKLAQLDKLKSNLIDTVSHEFRTPLTSIMGYTSRLMRHDVEIPEELRKKSLKVIKEQAERLNRMVDDLLVIPDLESSMLRFYIDSIELVPILERSIAYFKNKKPNKEVILYIPENIPSINTDPDRLEQVMVNLIGNAVKYSYDNTNIIVNVDILKENNKIQIDIINECDPISNDILSTLFDKFKRLDDNLTRTTRGSGLGLYISKGIVEAMGGEILLKYDNKFKASIVLPINNEKLDELNLN